METLPELTTVSVKPAGAAGAELTVGNGTAKGVGAGVASAKREEQKAVVPRFKPSATQNSSFFTGNTKISTSCDRENQYNI